MAAYLSPLGNEPWVDSNGDPLNGGKIYTYQAGTSTAAATYTSSTGLTPQANPVVLNSSGLPASPIWLTGGQSYKFIVKDANDVTLATIDNITGINDPAQASTVDEWVLFGAAPTYISATSFSVVGDQTGTFSAGRQIKSTNTGGTVYSLITATSFGAGVTTVTVTNNGGASLDSGMSSVSYGFLSALNPSSPFQSGQVLQMQTYAVDAGSTGNTSTTLVNTTGTSKTITPKSTNSVLIVEVAALGAVSGVGGVNNTATFQLMESGVAVGSAYTFGANSGAGGLGAVGPVFVRARLTNSARTVRSFTLGSKTANAGGAVDATSQQFTITEVQN